jgi:hypothetical protein
MTRRPLGRSTHKQKQPRLDSQTTWDVCLVFFDETAISLTPNVSCPRVVATHQRLCHSLAFPRTASGVRLLVHLPVWARWVL